jgi:hypothetical protein
MPPFLCLQSLAVISCSTYQINAVALSLLNEREKVMPLPRFVIIGA